MKIAYLILAHDNPMHLKRLIKALETDSCSFFVHIDKKSYLKQFIQIKNDHVILSKNRIPVYWGHFSQVKATLNLIDQAYISSDRFDRFVLLSGTDYPIRSATYIEKYFIEQSTTEFINMIKMPNLELGKPLSRLNHYKLTPYESDFLKFTQKILIRLGIVPRQRDYRKYLGNLQPYGGSTWWALTREAIETIRNFVKNKKSVVGYFKNTNHPFELFFQTILGNSPFMKNVKRNLTYNDWIEGGAHPAMINKGHVDLFAKNTIFDPKDSYGPGEFLFARKFSDKTAQVVDALERLIIERDGG